MSAAEPADQKEHGASAGTLGDVLYPDKSRTVALEKDWVKLVQGIAAGDQRALHALYERTHRMVYTLAARIINNRETAEEVTVDVFHDVWRRASTYDAENGTVIGWVMNQARSRTIDRLRHEQRKKRVNHRPDKPVAAAVAGDPGEAIEFRDQSRLLRRALTVLTVQERQAIETAYFSGLTYAETATRLNEPLGTIKTRIRSGLGKLRQALAGSITP
jgi:RNA polymerase sigma-70 factor, ECF subfamily